MQIHLDSSYVHFSIWAYSRCIHYLFDENRNLISWKQRKKEIENFPIKEQIFEDGYKVVRTREVKVCNDEYEDGREYIVDTLYLNDEIQTSKTEIDLFPMNKIYIEYTNVKKSQDEYRLKRDKSSFIFRLKYFKKKRIEILYEEISCQTAMLAYHFMARDSDELYYMRDYKKYLDYYYYSKKVPNKRELYRVSKSLFCRS